MNPAFHTFATANLNVWTADIIVMICLRRRCYQAKAQKQEKRGKTGNESQTAFMTQTMFQDSVYNRKE
jgi:hypothetical protein